jgi:histone deacetylase 11
MLPLPPSLPSALQVIYNAGTDVLSGDPLGQLAVSEAAVIERDEAVWAAALGCGAPIAMLLSGGYTAASTPAIAHSILNLNQKFGLVGQGA